MLCFFHKKYLFIDPNLNIGFDIRELMGVIQQDKYNGSTINDDLYCGKYGDQVRNIEGLLGIDSLYFMKRFRAIKCLRDNAVDSCLLRKNQIIHRRISLYSLWVISQWERMLRVVKNCLMKTIGQSSIEYFNFVTTLSEIVDAINILLLIYTSNENDVIPLTPKCFIKPHTKTNLVLLGRSNNDPLEFPVDR